MGNSSRTLVVGDVHGCREELERLLAACALTSSDRVILVGDLVAKGPDSQGVVELARKLKALAVLGNHDAHVLKSRGASLVERKQLRPEHREVVETLKEADWEYLTALPLYLRLTEYMAVVLHAGMRSGLPVEKQDRESLLYLRSVTADDKPSRSAGEGRPWGSLWRGPELALFGHDARRGLQRHPFALGLDTGCVYGGKLTGVLLPERKLVSVDARKTYFATG